MVGVESLHLAFSGPSWKERVRTRRALSHQWNRGFLKLHKRRLAKFNGVRQNFELHLKERRVALEARSS